MAQFGTAELFTHGLSKAKRLVFSTLAALTFVGCAVPGWRDAGCALGVLTLAGLSWLFLARHRDRFVGAQTIVLAGFTVAYGARVGSTNVLLIVVGVATAALLLNPDLFAGGQPVEVANLPGPSLATRPLIDSRVSAAAHTGLVTLIGVGAAFDLPLWVVSLVTLLVAGLSAAHVAHEVLRRPRHSQMRRLVRAAAERHQPEFAVYFSAPPGTAYHVTSWLPYFERVGRPFVVILREPHSLAVVAAATSAPVIVCEAASDVDNVIVSSIKAVFYMNNGMKNSQMVRFNRLTHVQLLHGDSDKASSYNPVTAMFTRVYVAGQAAIDRYAANGVHIDPEKFEIVGRPQIESIEVASAGRAPRAGRTVMYGTTWAGAYADANYCSLDIGAAIVEELLRREVTVVFRPHPYVIRRPKTLAQARHIEALLAADRAKSGREHLFGKPALDTSLFDCFNRSDALISDVSAIASDFLYSEKPLAMTDMQDDAAEFARAFPVATAAYVLRPDAANLASVLDELLDTDSLAVTRRGVKEHYLGRFPASSYATAFVESVRRELTSAPDRVGAAV